MQLTIHSDTSSPGPEKMDRPKRGKRKTLDKLETPEITKVMENGANLNGDSFTPRRSRRKASESQENGFQETPKATKGRRKSMRKISEPSDEKTPEKTAKIPAPKLSESAEKSRDRKNSENGRKLSESSDKSISRERKISETFGRKLSESSDKSISRERKISESLGRKLSESSETSKKTGTKRKTSESGKTEALSVADRIKLLSHEQNQKSTPPRTDSVLQLLLQGLNSKDKRILESVLERAEEELINDTVKRLPFEAILPLLEVLQHYIQGKMSLVFAHGKWLKAVLQHHTSFVISSPECEEILTSMNAIIEARTKNYSKILQLRGKLEMMVHQVTAQPENLEPSTSTSKEALLVYQDEDSSDELQLDDMLMPNSDTDNDDWDQQSEDENEDIVEVDESSEEDGDEEMVNGVESDDDDDVMDAD